MALVLARCAAVALDTLQAASLRSRFAPSGFTPTQIHYPSHALAPKQSQKAPG